MNGATIPGARAGFPRGLLGALLLILAAESAVARHKAWFSMPAAANWEFRARSVRDEAPKAEVLCLGSSHVQFGALPVVLEKATGRRAYNLALSNGRLPATFFLLKRALDAGATPASLVIDTNDPPAERSPAGAPSKLLGDNERNWPELLTLAECRQLARETNDPDFFQSMLLARVLPSFKARAEVRHFLKNLGRLGKFRPALDYRAYHRNWVANRGAFVLEPRKVTPADSDARSVGGPFEGDRLGQDRVSALYLNRILDLARERRIPVFFVLAPIHPNWEHSLRERGLLDFATEIARGAWNASPGVIVVDGRLSGYPAEAFYDQIHLSSVGANTFSGDLGAVIRRYFADPATAPRWVNLPPYRERPLDPELEDVEHSTLALAGRLARRRQ